MKVIRVGGPALAAILAVGCASQKQADRAIKAAETAITAQHTEALRFAPDSFAALMQGYGAARKAYDAKDWAAAIKAADDVAARARGLPPAIAEGRERGKERWPAARDSVSAMLAALRGRLDEMSRTRRFPEGWSAAAAREAQTRVDSLTAALGKAGTEFDRGDLMGAMHATERVRAEAVQLMGRLGLTPLNPHGGT